MAEDLIERAEIYPASAEDLCLAAQIERYIPQKERDSYDAADFAGPDRSFPVTSQAQLDAAAHLIGHAADPDAVKRKAISIAKRKGFTLPKAWQEDEGEKKDERAAQADPFQAPEHPMLYAPIVRIDKEKREVEGVATSEAIDSYGTIFSYEASKRAFQAWIERTANCREMHDRKAVGKGIGVFFDDANKQVVVRSRISRSADGDNTWIKINEGILNGLSVGAINPVWDSIERGGKKYPYLTSYDLSELSYVDNASNRDAQNLAICRADGLTELVDVTEQEQPMAPTPTSGTPSIERQGARVSSDTRAGNHVSIGHTLMAAKSQAQNCNCDACQALMAALDPDNDGDIDAFGGQYGDTDGDSAGLYQSSEDEEAERMVTTMLERAMPLLREQIEQTMAPIYQRQQQFLARMAQVPEPEPVPPPTMIDTTALEERLTTAIVERVAAASNLSEVRTDLSVVKAAVERIEAQPMPGGPVLNGASQPVEKRLAIQSPSAAHPQNTREELLGLLGNLQATGALDTADKQVAAAALAAIPVRGRTG